MTLVELLFSSALFVVVLLTTLSMLRRDGDLSRSNLGASLAEGHGRQLVYRLERELSDVLAAQSVAQLSAALGAGAGTAVVDSTLGFPSAGILLIDRGTGIEERIEYAGLDDGAASFQNLVRGVQCTQDASHGQFAEVRWAAYGEALPSAAQAAPPAGSWDGRARILGTSVFFRGDGTGFSFRVPIDPSGANPPDYLSGDDVQWGALVEGNPSLTGWSAIQFVRRRVLDEAIEGGDLNNDGDRIDVFDLGQLRRTTWDTADASIAGDDLGLGPTIVLQEQCNWGGDLDGDGFDDPIFLWDPETRFLSMRVFVFSNTVPGMPLVRRIESAIYLRNPGL